VSRPAGIGVRIFHGHLRTQGILKAMGGNSSVLDLAAQSDDVEESVRHLAPEDLRAYASGRMESARLGYCQTHLDSCEICRDEVEDLRTLKGDLSVFPRPEPSRRRRRLTLPGAAAAAIILLAAVTTVLWWKRESPPANKPSVAMTIAQAPTPPAATSAQTGAAAAVTSPAGTHGTRGADEIAALPGGGAKPSLAAPIQQHGKVQLPTEASRPGERAPTSPGPGAQQASPKFALLGPLGEVSDTRPEFTWQPVAGAMHYSIAIVDARLHPVEHSHALHTTAWRPRRPLHHGRTYLWQVTATLHGGKKVVASTPGVLTESSDRVKGQ
jgi:hypothetical protein